jgi:hypothetical protein
MILNESFSEYKNLIRYLKCLSYKTYMKYGFHLFTKTTKRQILYR